MYTDILFGNLSDVQFETNLYLYCFFHVKNGELITRYRRNPNSEKMDIGMLLAEERNKIHFLQCV